MVDFSLAQFERHGFQKRFPPKVPPMDLPWAIGEEPFAFNLEPKPNACRMQESLRAWEEKDAVRKQEVRERELRLQDEILTQMDIDSQRRQAVRFLLKLLLIPLTSSTIQGWGCN